MYTCMLRDLHVNDLCIFPSRKMYMYMHMLYVVHWLCTMYCTTYFSIKESALFKFAFTIFNSSIQQFNSLTLSRCVIPSIFNLICIVHTLLHSPHSPLLAFETGRLWYRCAGSPIKDPAPYPIWTQPLLCLRGRRARRGQLFHRPPNAKRSTAYSKISK